MEAFFAVAVVELVRLTVLALFLERALAVVFETRFWRARLDGRGLSPLVAVGVAIWLCTTWGLDAVSAVASVGHLATGVAPYRTGGAILTALILAGGSKVAMELWRVVTGLRREGP